MPTDVFHIDANGVHISVDRAVFAEHTYATRNIHGVVTVTDKGMRWPGMSMLFIGFGLTAAGLITGHTVTLLFGIVAILSGSLNLARKRPKYGVRIVTQRGPVYVLASQDKTYAETVSAALRKAVDAAGRRTESRRAAHDSPQPAQENPQSAHPEETSRGRGESGASPPPPRRFRRRRR